jgi:hypothetical protein
VDVGLSPLAGVGGRGAAAELGIAEAQGRDVHPLEERGHPHLVPTLWPLATGPPAGRELCRPTLVKLAPGGPI